MQLDPKIEALLRSGRDRETPKQSPREEELLRGDSVDVARSRIRLGVKEDVSGAQAKWNLADTALEVLLRSRSAKAQGQRLSFAGDAVQSRPCLRRTGTEADAAAPPKEVRREPQQQQQEEAEEDQQMTEKELAERSAAADKAAAERAAARGARKAETRETAANLKARMARVKASECAMRSADRNKRRLRAKILEVLQDVHRRRTLAIQQERGRRIREAKHAARCGPSPGLGNATPWALQGFSALLGGYDDAGVHANSPRRAALLAVLSLQEFELLRRDPAFFFQSPAVAPDSTMLRRGIDEDARGPGIVSRMLESHKRSSLSMEGSKQKEETSEDAPVLPHLPPWDDTEALWDLTQFFEPRKEDKDLDVAEWVQKLKTRMAAMHDAGGTMTANFRSLYIEQKASEKAAEQKLAEEAEAQQAKQQQEPEEPLELMPCLGRHPQVPPGDMHSPVLAKVREVYHRREIADARLVEERRQAVEQRFAHNAFKAREQQREIHLKSTTQKELHKVQMLDVEERKRALEAAEVERRTLMDLGLRKQVAEACQKADDIMEAKRRAASENLEHWKHGVQRAQRTLRETEVSKVHEGVRYQKLHAQRLQKLGETRQGAASSMERRNEQLRAKIQMSLNMQMETFRQQQAEQLAESIESKLEAAAMRRTQGAARYQFREKAFGTSAVDLDLKHQPVTVDRRQDTWRRSAQSWAKQRMTFSSPVLPSAAGLAVAADLDTTLREPCRTSAA